MESENEPQTFPNESEELLGKELSSSADFAENHSAASISIDLESSGEQKSPLSEDSGKASSPAPSEPSGEPKSPMPTEGTEEPSSSANSAESGDALPAKVTFGPENRPGPENAPSEGPQEVQLPWNNPDCDSLDLPLECFGPVAPSLLSARQQEANALHKRLRVNGQLTVSRRTHCHVALLQNELLTYLADNINDIYRPDLDTPTFTSPWMSVQRLAARLYHSRSKFSTAAKYYLAKGREGHKKRLDNLDRERNTWGQVDPKPADAKSVPMTIDLTDDGVRSVKPPKAPEKQAARSGPKFDPSRWPDDEFDHWLIHRCAPKKAQKAPFWNFGTAPSPPATLAPPKPMISTAPAPFAQPSRRPQPMGQQQLPPVGVDPKNWPLPVNSAPAGSMPCRKRRR